ncbi:MAG: V-type ATP synthase subunit A [Candidatus Odinarchaeia archaeon]
MERIGEVVKIAGPLVTAKGIPGVKMYEVCKVGEEELIGEVNRVEGDLAYIQVYEETAGIKPGEKVIGTGRPLSLELGPGLIGQMFDGIQRPLPSIEKVAGDFITRGVTVNALPRDKKWKFTPTVKKGDKVVGGSELGTVPETTLVKHIIMVPPNMEGEITEIAPPGEYTVEETIAKLKTKEGKIEELKMMQIWPVRKPRPFKTKLPSEVPLITGQRIIDTFFPVAKGGTSGIPGGFGTGKCVLADTPVLLKNRGLIKIKDLFEEIKGDKPDLTLKEELIKVNKDVVLYSFDGMRILPMKVSHVYRGFSNKIIKLKTTSGRIIKVTPAHKLITFNSNGFFEEKAAAELKEDDYIVIPRKINVETTYQELTDFIISIKELCSRDPYVNKEAVSVLRNVVKKIGGYNKLAKILKIKKTTLEDYSVGRNKMPLWVMKKIYELDNKKFIIPGLVGIARSNKCIKIPEELDEKLGEILGLLFSDGMITKRSVKFYNNSKSILNHFKELFTHTFGVTPNEKDFRTVRGVEVNSAVIVKILRALGMPNIKKSNTVNIPAVLLNSPESVIAAFIRGYYLGNGTFSKGVVEFNSSSEQLIQGVSYLLTRLGILFSVSKRNNKSYKLSISNIPELKKLVKVFNGEKYKEFNKITKLYRYTTEVKAGRTTRDLIPLNKEVLREFLKIYSKRVFEKNTINIDNYVYGGEKLSTNMLTKIINFCTVEDETILKLSSLLTAFEFVVLDKIEKITINHGKFTVYDVTVPGTHNFVGGKIPTLFHNTVTLHQVASWADANIIVYVGCGERGNEMTEVLEKFPTYKDPRSGEPLMNRTVLVANTSNMPVAAREASIYTAITMAEYFRDMGYDVALQADSTSRWAEALREMSGRLEEMPGEEGYPAYLASRLAEFYERAGRVETIGDRKRIGSVTVTGAVSPPGGDFSEPVTQATLRIIKTFWALDSNLSRRRHFPAINWLTSYSLYLESLQDYYNKNLNPSWNSLREQAMALLEKEEALTEIVQLVGPDALPESERVILEAARMIREDYLQQSALHPVDTFCPLYKMYRMLKIIITFYNRMVESVNKGVTLREIMTLPAVDKIARMKIIPYEDREKMEREFDKIEKELEAQFKSITVSEIKASSR